jgi:hypothetical protein
MRHGLIQLNRLDAKFARLRGLYDGAFIEEDS